MNADRQFLTLLKAAVASDDDQTPSLGFYRERLLEILKRLRKLVPPPAADQVTRLHDALDGFSINIAVSGEEPDQSFALINALSARSNLLPTDVGPKAPAVSAVHINARKPSGKNAVFRFFGTEEWREIGQTGGLLGELTKRAGHDQQAAMLAQKALEWQHAVRSHLDRDVGQFLDGQHSFLGFSSEIIGKYVATPGSSATTKPYADLTKAADLYIDNGLYALPTTLTGISGAYDPFLIREKTAIDRLSKMDIGVAVLSPQSVGAGLDLGLLRSLSPKQMIIFVDGAHQFEDLDQEIDLAKRDICRRLRDARLPGDIPVVFGSVIWAEAAATGVLTKGMTSSLSRVFPGRKDQTDTRPNAEGPDLGRDVSGLHALRQIILEKSADLVARPFIDDIRLQALSVAEQSAVAINQARHPGKRPPTDQEIGEQIKQLRDLLTKANAACTQAVKTACEALLVASERAFADFLSAETTRHGTIANREDWYPDTRTLRNDLNAAYQGFTASICPVVDDVFADLAHSTAGITARLLDPRGPSLSVRMPRSIKPRTPVAWPGTMMVEAAFQQGTDKASSGAQSAPTFENFAHVTELGMRSVLRELENGYALDFAQAIRRQLHHFMMGHIETLKSLTEGGRSKAAQTIGSTIAANKKLLELDHISSDLKLLFKSPNAVLLTPSRGIEQAP